MSAETQTLLPDQPIQVKKTTIFSGAVMRVVKYISVRIITLFASIVVGIYLTIMIANMGGYVDQIMRSEIRERLSEFVFTDPAYRDLNIDQKNELVDARIALEEKRLGLDRPFVIRSLSYLRNGLTLNLGRAQNMTSDSGSKLVRLIILERLPPTLLLFATANLILFFTSVFIALALSRNYGGFWDKVVLLLTPTSAPPAWFYGVFLIVFFAAVVKILPFGGMVSAPPPETRVDYALDVLKHLILPTASIILSAIFLSIYNWRTFFLIYSSEDYVEMAKAKGLSARNIERHYILRPTLPTIITSFALILINLWTGAIILEGVFGWPGLGTTFFRATGLYDTPVIVGSTIIYAYLLGMTVLLLDIVYVLVDPRVQIGGSNS